MADFREHSDVALADAVHRAEPGAMAALYERVRPAIERTLSRLLGIHDADYDDMLQNSLIELVRSLPRYRGTGPLAAFAAVLAARVVYRELKGRRSARLVLDIRPSDEVSVEAEDDPERESAARELLGRVRAHLDTLEQEKAWTYLLHDLCGYELSEIAQITGVSIAAAQSRLVRGRKQLEEKLAADPELAAMLEKEANR